MNRKNKQQTERVETSSGINIHINDMEVWAREVKAQMTAVLNKKNAQREAK
jgi:hypothetical protein